MNDQLTFVVDLGSAKTCVIAATAGDGDLPVKVEATALAPSAGVRRGVVIDEELAAEALDAALAVVEAAVGRRAERITAGIGGAHVLGANTQGFLPIYPPQRPIRREDVLNVINHSRQVLLEPGREQIMAVPSEFRLDGARGIDRPIGMSGARLEVVTHIVTGQIAALQALDRTIGRTGRRVEQLVALPVASGLGVAQPEDLEAGCLIVDIGEGTTGIAAFVGGSIAYTGCLPVGGGHVTSDVAHLINTEPAEAERLKLAHGHVLARSVSPEEAVSVRQVGTSDGRPLQRRVLCDVIESRMRETAGLVRQVLEPSGLLTELRGGCFVTGGGSLLPGTEELFAECLGLAPVRISSPKGGGRFGTEVETPRASAAMGLATYALAGEEMEFAPVTGHASWKDRIRSLKSLFGAKG